MYIKSVDHLYEDVKKMLVKRLFNYKADIRNWTEIFYASINKRIEPVYPDFLCIGAPRTGSTWLHSALLQHPDIFISKRKELHFFDEPLLQQYGGKIQDINKRKRGSYYDMNSAAHWRWYHMQFHGAGNMIKGEITPAYSRLTDQRIELISERMKDIRVIYMMRNPIERAWSSVKFFSWEFTNKNLKEADHEKIMEFVMHPRRLMGGDYESVIRRWEKFIDPANILYLFYDDLVDSPSSQLRRVCDFLGVSHDKSSSSQNTEQRVNRSVQKFTIPDDIEKQLHEYYDGQIEFLENKFNRDLSHWRAAN